MSGSALRASAQRSTSISLRHRVIARPRGFVPRQSARHALRGVRVCPCRVSDKDVAAARASESGSRLACGDCSSGRQNEQHHLPWGPCAATAQHASSTVDDQPRYQCAETQRAPTPVARPRVAALNARQRYPPSCDVRDGAGAQPGLEPPDDRQATRQRRCHLGSEGDTAQSMSWARYRVGTPKRWQMAF